MAANVEVLLTGNTAGLETAVNRAAATVSASTAKMLDGIKGVTTGMVQTEKVAEAAGQALAQSAGGYDQVARAANEYAATQVLVRNAINEVRAAERAGTVDRQAAAAQIIQLRNVIAGASAEYRKQADTFRKGAGEIVGASGSQRAGLQQLGYQLSDVATQFAGGQKAALIFAQQAPQVVQAVQMMSGGTSKFATFMQGPWGIALGVGTAVIGALVTKLLDSDDAAKKAKDAHIDLANAIDRQKASHDALAKAIDDYNDGQKKSTENTRLYVQQAKEAAEADLKRALALRELLKAELERQQSQAGGILAPQGYQQEQARMEGQIADRQRQNLEDIKRLQAEVNNRALQLGDFAAKAIDPLEAIRQKYDDIRKVIRDTSSMGMFNGKPVDVVLRQVGIEQAAAEKVARDAARSSTGSNLAAQASVGDMVALIKQLFPGAAITSTTGGRHVAGSDHYAGRAIDFVPAGGMGEYSKAQVEQMIKDAGVNIRRNASGVEQFFGPGDKGHNDHFHVAWTGSASPEEAARRQAAAQQKLQALADQQVRQQKEYADLTAGLDGDLLAAKRANITDAAQIAQIARDQVAVERDKLIADVEAKAQLNPTIKAHKEELEEKIEQVAAQKLITIDTQEMQRRADEQLSLTIAANDNQKELLSMQEQFAVTQEDRRRIQLSILAIEKENERRALEAQANDPRGTDESRGKARLGLSTINARYGFQEQGIRESTRSPLDRYIADNDPRLIGEKVENLYVAELEAVRTGIDDAIANALGVKDPLLKGLIDMFIQQVLIDPIARALQAHMGGGGGFFGTALSFVAGAVGGGGLGNSLSTASSNVASLAGNIEANNASRWASLALAGGGMVTGPGGPTSDSVPLWASNGEYVLNAETVRRLGKAKLDLINHGASAPRFATGGFIGKYPSDIAANNNGGDTYHLGGISFPGVTNARDARETARQFAASFQNSVASAKKKGY